MSLFKSILNQLIKTKRELIEVLKLANQKKIIDTKALSILESVVQIDRLNVKDIVLPRHQLDVIDINSPMDLICDKIIRTGHSRFPVIDGEISNVLGIFHSKDLAKYFADPKSFELKDHLRQAYFVPEVKRLDSLMHEMQFRKIHMAIVVDEFTNVVGVVTLEMIVEQIVGEIEDEYDISDESHEIVELADGTLRIRGSCKLSQIKQCLGLEIEDSTIETLGGYLIQYRGKVPLSGDVVKIHGLNFKIVASDSRKIKSITVKPIK